MKNIIRDKVISTREGLVVKEVSTLVRQSFMDVVEAHLDRHRQGTGNTFASAGIRPLLGFSHTAAYPSHPADLLKLNLYYEFNTKVLDS